MILAQLQGVARTRIRSQANFSENSLELENFQETVSWWSTEVGPMDWKCCSMKAETSGAKFLGMDRWLLVMKFWTRPSEPTLEGKIDPRGTSVSQQSCQKFTLHALPIDHLEPWIRWDRDLIFLQMHEPLIEKEKAPLFKYLLLNQVAQRESEDRAFQPTLII